MEIWTKRNDEKRTTKKLVRRAITRISKAMKQKTHITIEKCYTKTRSYWKFDTVRVIVCCECSKNMQYVYSYLIVLCVSLVRWWNISCSFYKWKKKSTFAKIQFTLWMASSDNVFNITTKKLPIFLLIFFLVHKPVYRIR